MLLQSTLPHGERHASYNQRRSSALLQSTLPHGERLLPLGPGLKRLHASIHAPARGATPWLIAPVALGKASIHAPARGAT